MSTGRAARQNVFHFTGAMIDEQRKSICRAEVSVARSYRNTQSGCLITSKELAQ
jgi:hypothetical protein